MYRFNKKLKTLLSMIAFCVVLTISMKTEVFAAQASVTGPGTVRAGDTIILTLTVSSQGSFGIEGKLSYDSSVVTFQGMSAEISGWKVENNGNKFVIYDDALSNPLGGSSAVAKMTFKVNQNVPAGTAVNISLTDLISTDGNSENNIGNANYSIKIARPLSTNNSLSAIYIDGVNLVPAFNENVLNYDAGEVEYAVTSLNISAVPREGTSIVSINGNSLNVGNNIISITVTAENGLTRTYTVNVRRKQDPNYVPDSNASLSSITINQGILSPAFSPDITEYIVYLPYESKTISAIGTAESVKAQGVIGSGEVNLSLGENHIAVTGKAEDGTEKQYNITVVVMPEYSGEVTEAETEEATNEEATTEEATEETTMEETTESVTAVADNSHDNKGGVNIIIVVILVIVSAVAGFIVCYILAKKKIIIK